MSTLFATDLPGQSSGLLIQAAKALEETIAGHFSAVEIAWLSPIERLRQDLLKSTRTFRFLDYGARRPDLPGRSNTREQLETYPASVADVCRRCSKNRRWAGLLFKFVRQLRPATCLELGTCVGISTAYLAAALQVNGTGDLVTLEGDPTLAEIARANLAALGHFHVPVLCGHFGHLLPEVLPAHQPWHFVFVDGHHDGAATLAYWSLLKPVLAPQSLVVFDDNHWSRSMLKAWSQIAQDDRVVIALTVGDFGCAILDYQVKAKRHLEWSFK